MRCSSSSLIKRSGSCAVICASRGGRVYQRGAPKVKMDTRQSNGILSCTVPRTAKNLLRPNQYSVTPFISTCETYDAPRRGFACRDPGAQISEARGQTGPPKL